MHLDTFIPAALLILLATSISVVLFKYLGLGSVLGLLAAGIAIGPHSPGPRIVENIEEIRHFAELGVVLLLFLIGLEMRPSRLWAMRREVFGLGTLQITVTGAAMAAYFSLFEYDWRVSLLIGMTFALSSTAFVIQLLQERGEIASEHGTTAFAVLLMQDLAVVPLLTLVPLLSATAPLSAQIPLWEQALVLAGMLALLIGFGRFLMPIVLHHLATQTNREGFVLVVLLAVFFASWAMHEAGVSMALGAFVMGMLLSGSRYRLQVQTALEPYKGILMSLFFVAVGMSIDLEALADAPLLFAQHTVVLVLLKIGILLGLVSAFGFSRGVAVRVAFYLGQGGEFGFVLFGSAVVLDVIDQATFIQAVGVISVTMLLTPLLVRAGEALSRYLERFDRESPKRSEPGPNEVPPQSVVIGGYGRVGHTVATLLYASGVPVVVFDTDPGRVAQGRADGLQVYYGDVGDPDLLYHAGVANAALVVMTIDHAPAAERAVAHIRTSFPAVPVIARARDLAATSRLIAAGATEAIPDVVESSLRLASLALQKVNVPEDDVDILIGGVRDRNYELAAREPVPRTSLHRSPADK